MGIPCRYFIASIFSILFFYKTSEIALNIVQYSSFVLGWCYTQCRLNSLNIICLKSTIFACRDRGVGTTIQYIQLIHIHNFMVTCTDVSPHVCERNKQSVLEPIRHVARVLYVVILVHTFTNRCHNFQIWTMW